MNNNKQVQPDINEFMNKVKKMEKGEQLDLSSDEDLSIAIMNLISMEEHFFFTYNKTKDTKYLDLLNEIREMRKSALKRIIKDYEGEVWCISKHLLAGSMRFMEVGTKALTKGDKNDAEDMFQKSYQLYSLFWGLNLGLVQTKDMNHAAPNEIAYVNDDPKPKQKGAISIFAKLGEVVQKAIDCCKE
jgi:rhamnogalacturonyl hydrolase YesR